MSRPARLLSACGLAALCLHSQALPSANRRALLIGNSQYRGLPPLAAPVNDIRSLAAALRELKFEVTAVENVGLEAMRATIEQQFVSSVEAGDTVLVYFAGYGIQSGGENLLLPVDFDPADSRDMLELGYVVARIPQLLDRRKAALKILLLDCSREEPRLAQRASGFGLAVLEDFPGTLVSYSAAVGQNAVEARDAPSGAFARALVEALQVAGADLNDFMQQVRRGVDALSGGAQRPYINNNYLGEFFFRPPVKKPEPPPAVAAHASPVPVRERFEINKDRQEYVYIPPGAFQMGCVEAAGAPCRENEKPRHRVEISSGFWIGRTEVTVQAFERYARENKLKMPKPPDVIRRRWEPSLPIVNVDWEEAAAYCGWAGGRLPTEAEWEYAARGNVADQVFPFGTELAQSREKANFYGKSGNDSYEALAPVRSFDPNGFDLFDMAGNVWEWCADYYHPAYYRESPAKDPKGPPAGRQRVARGGSWTSDAKEHLRISYREGYDRGGNKVGFRCVLDDTPETRAGFRK